MAFPNWEYMAACAVNKWVMAICRWPRTEAALQFARGGFIEDGRSDGLRMQLYHKTAEDK